MTVQIYHVEKNRKIQVKDLKLKVNPTYDKHGKNYNQQYVEFTVVGQVREYPDFMLLSEFRRHNPDTGIGEEVS